MSQTRQLIFWRSSREAAVMASCICLLIAQNSCQAGNHYCPDKYTVEIDLTVRSYQDEKLIPRLEVQSDLPAADDIQCSWVLKFSGLTGPRPLLLQGIPDALHNAKLENISGNFKQLKYEVHTPNVHAYCSQNAPRTEQVNSGLFEVLFLNDSRSYLSVSFSLEPHTIRTPIILRALMPQAGFCSRDSLSFHGSCYAVSPTADNVTVALSNIQGDAQLASFVSLTQINEFVAANKARLDVHPYRRPLDLSQRIRIGLFYRAADASILALYRTESGCELRPVERSEEMLMAPVSGACGSLQVKSEFSKVRIEFVDCNQGMPTLASFPETPISASVFSYCTQDCHSVEISTIVAELNQESLKLPILPVGIVAVLVTITCLIPAGFVTLVVWYYMHRRLARRGASTVGRDPYEAISLGTEALPGNSVEDM